MTSSIKVMARVMITPGREGAFEKHAAKLSVATRAEEGCLSYHLHRNLNQTGVYVFIEEWASPEIWRRHMSGEAIRSFNAQLPAGTIAQIEIHPLEQIA
jgi:quinol monooxygenase YgiN